MKVKLIAFLALATLVTIVMLQNTDVVTLRFLFWRFSMSRIVLLPLAVLSGFAMGVMVAKIPRGKKT